MKLIGFEGKKVAVFGLGRSGIDGAKCLAENGALVTCFDDHVPAQEKARAAGLTVEKLDLSLGYDFLLLTPGVPLKSKTPHPIVIEAEENNVTIIGDIELLHYMEDRPTLIAITGSNGKSTTTTLLTHILKSAAVSCEMGGNIGIPVTDLPALGSEGYYILELSSYQLDLLDQLKIDIGMILNITPDHLDRYLSFDDYAASKIQMAERSHKTYASIDSEPLKTLIQDFDFEAVSVGQAVSKGCFVTDQGVLYHDRTEIGSVSGLKSLSGHHNWQNIAFCYEIAEEIGVRDGTFFAALQSYPGLPHRQEYIRQINGVDYVNDSKATNPESAEKALQTYENIAWLAGGKSKNASFDSLQPFVGNVRKVYLFGETASDLEAFCQKCQLDYARFDSMRAALFAAHAETEIGTVLLSPACSSFDQFDNFEHRGDVFRNLVRALD